MMGSAAPRAAKKPRTHNSTNARNEGDARVPPGSINWDISWDSLKAAVSKPRLPPGEVPRMKPKSMWTRWPPREIMMLPLWRSLACSR